MAIRGYPVLALLVLFFLSVQAFLPPTLPTPASTGGLARRGESTHPSSSALVSRTPLQMPTTNLQRRGQPLYGIFGLGTPELVVIALVAGIVLGPDKIVDLARGVGKAAGELKAVPQEFEKGLKTGEEAAAKTKAELAKEKAEKKE